MLLPFPKLALLLSSFAVASALHAPPAPRASRRSCAARSWPPLASEDATQSPVSTVEPEPFDIRALSEMHETDTAVVVTAALDATRESVKSMQRVMNEAAVKAAHHSLPQDPDSLPVASKAAAAEAAIARARTNLASALNAAAEREAAGKEAERRAAEKAAAVQLLEQRAEERAAAAQLSVA